MAPSEDASRDGIENPVQVHRGAFDVERPPVDLNGSLPALVTPDGHLNLLTVQPPGKKPMSGADYLRGLKR